MARERRTPLLRSINFWGTAGLLAIVGALHYYEYLGIPYTAPYSLQYALTRHASDRILFLFPMVYVGFVFGLKAGLLVAGTSFAVMLPRAVALDAVPMASVLEALLTVVLGSLTSVWLSVRVKERDQFKKALAELEVTHRQLQRYVRVARSSEKRLTILNAISTMLSQSLEPQQVMQQAVGMVAELIEVEAALLYLLDEKGESLYLAAHLGVSEEFAEKVRAVRVGEGFIGRVAATGEPLTAKDFTHDPGMQTPEAQQMKFERQLVVPVRCKGKIVGTLCVAMRRPREFLNEEVDLVMAIASQIGVSVENARLYDREREVVRQLRLSERRYRALFEGASDAIWVHDLEGTITAVNSAAARLTGYSVEEMAGTKVHRLLAKEGMDGAREVRRRLMGGRPGTLPMSSTCSARTAGRW